MRNTGKGIGLLGGSMRRVGTSALIAAFLAALACAPAASAASGIEAKAVMPDAAEPGHEFLVEFQLLNSGPTPLEEPIHFEETLSPGLHFAGEPPFEQCDQSAAVVTCTVAPGLISGGALNFEQRLAVDPGASADQAVHMGIDAGAAGTEAIDQDIVLGPPLPYGIEKWAGSFLDPEGETLRQAGASPDRFVTELAAPLESAAFFEDTVLSLAPHEQLKDAFVDLPAGLVGNPQAVPTCPLGDLARFAPETTTPACSPDAQVGLFKGSLGGFGPVIVPVYNIEPSVGSAAQFGFNYLGTVVQLIGKLSPGPNYHIEIVSLDNNTTLTITGVKFEFWGAPADEKHGNLRGPCLSSSDQTTGANGLPRFCPTRSGSARVSFLRMPTRCAGSNRTPISLDTYQHPTVRHEASFEFPSFIGCAQVPFDPSIEARPTSQGTEEPTGLSVKVQMPQQGLLNPDGIAESDLSKARVSLPTGVTINPSQAEGLGVCTLAQYESTELSAFPTPGKGCPDDSKIGTVEVTSPLLKEKIPGDVYIAQQDDPSTSTPGAENPFDSLLAIYVVMEEPERGLLIKLPGEVETDERSGRIVTTFDDLPQLPFSSFDFKFREGARAPLVTPPTCGSYDTVAEFWPHSNPNGQPTVTKSSFNMGQGIGGGPCPPQGVPGFDPGFSAGTINNNAAAYSPTLMRITRKDGEQDLTKFSATLPPGLLAKLGGVGRCPDQAIAVAKTKTGKEELASPSCPAASKIGRTQAGAGVGSVLTYVPGSLYLAGPYNGAPLSVVAITPAVAGPFDVGAVVVREALDLNSKTAEVNVDGESSDPIPHILKGIPLKLRDLRVYVDRESFTLNPTNCDPSAVGATLFGSNADVFNPADDVPVNRESRFQAANCASLGFKPKLSLKLRGGTARGAHPALTATYKPRKGDANVKGLVVRLPRSAFLDQAHIRTICTRVQFAQKSCPKGAKYGFIKAWTPLLDEPLEGPVWLRSSNHKLPDLVFDLKGLVDVEVSTRIDSVKGGIRARVEDAPDAPISKVLLKMQGAKKGLVINSRDLCGSTNRANVEFEGQNGKTARANPQLKPECRKGRKGK